MPGQYFVALASILVFVMVFELVRTRRLSESLSLFWLTFAALMVVAASLGFPYLIHMAGYLGVIYPPSALFLLAILFLLAFTLYLSVAISALHDQNKNLAQEVALLRVLVEERSGGG